MQSMNASIQFYRANVYQPFAPRTPLSLFHCVADIREFKCHESFFGSKSKHYSVHSRTVSPKECLHAVKTHISSFGRLFPTSSTRWSTNTDDVYTCKWLKAQTNHFKHFTITLYEGELVGDDSFIHQPLTHNTCYYRNFSSSPSEIPTSQIVWLPSNHFFQRFRDPGLYDIQQLSDFILIPRLDFGGAIQNTQNCGLLFLLDNSFLVVRRKPTPSAKFLSNACPMLQSGLLEAHLTLILENQRSNMISLWDQFCTTRNRLIQIQHWMIRYFPDSSAIWVTDSPGYHVEISGDAILLSKCHIYYFI